MQLPKTQTNSIDTKNIPFGHEPSNKSTKSMNKHCDNASIGNSSNNSIVISRRTSNAAKPQSGDLIDLDHGIEDT